MTTEVKGYTEQTLTLRSARAQARAKSLKDGGRYLIDPPICSRGDMAAPLTEVRYLNNIEGYAAEWYFLGYGPGEPISCHDLLVFLESQPVLGAKDKATGGWLEVRASGLAHITKGGKMFMPLAGATNLFHPPYSMSLTGVANGRGHNAQRAELEYTPHHAGIESNDANIADYTTVLEVPRRQYTAEELFRDLLAEINTVAKPGLVVPATRARRLAVEGDALSVDGLVAKLENDELGYPRWVPV